ncbi:DUF2637 domain-containing protein [Saccharopolyspora phatthalungensis]|uniref:DUF2637 domain-containing protein n=1 Tax=Saccharopolyspora phatthalungensis TaxID=664693 RepID=A0A840Q263_9PSEU|nr:DUF2637 domain-containing protein [Saccharopolyspora phatthalungensis]MBB5154030.1 hypothetical protein [Saccharopolyspora phatthalungensis]
MRPENVSRAPSAGLAQSWLSPVALVLVALAAVMGWGASFVGLHEYGMTSMTGFDWYTAWLVPATFDGAAFACTLMTYRASINGRSALRARMLMWGFTAVSAWINWIHQTTLEARLVAAGLPVAAVAVFDIVLLEMRADFEARHGRTGVRLRPGLLLVRWLVDRAGTAAAFRAQITDIPVHHLVGLGIQPPATPDGQDKPAPAPEPDQPPAPTPPQEPAPTQKSPAVAKRGPNLPPPMVKAVLGARSKAAAQGRELTVADVQAVINISGELAERIVADYTTNGHPVA